MGAGPAARLLVLNFWSVNLLFLKIIIALHRVDIFFCVLVYVLNISVKKYGSHEKMEEQEDAVVQEDKKQKLYNMIIR